MQAIENSMVARYWYPGQSLPFYPVNINQYAQKHKEIFIYAKMIKTSYQGSSKVQTVLNIKKLHPDSETIERPLPPPEWAANAPLSPLPYYSHLNLVDDSRKVFVHIHLRTSNLELQPSPLNSLIYLKHLTWNIATKRETLTSPPQSRRLESMSELRWLRPAG